MQQVVSFEEVAALKRQLSRKNRKCGIFLFCKISFFKDVALLEKLILCSSTCFDKEALLEISLSQVIPKSNCLKNFLFSRKDCSVEFSLRKIRYAAKNDWFKDMNLSKTELFKKATTLKKQLLQKSDSCLRTVTLKKFEGDASPKIKLT